MPSPGHSWRSLKPWLVPLLLCLPVPTSGAEAQVVVIAHPAVTLDTLSRSELMDYYTGDLSFWPDDLAVVLLDLKPKNATKETFYDYLGKRPSRLKSIWMKRMLSGEGDPPEAMKSEPEIVEKVASTPGALGFVSRALVTDKVKTLLIIPAEK